MTFTVVLASDGSAQANVARDLVAALALPQDATVRIVSALGTAPSLAGLSGSMRDELIAGAIAAIERELAEYAAPLQRHGLRVECAALEGRAATAIVDDAVSARADLVVVGSHGRGELGSLLLGSVSAEVVDRAPCPVLVARGRALERVILAEDGSTNARLARDVVTGWEIFRKATVRVVSVAHVAPYFHSGIAPSQQALVHRALVASLAATRHEHEHLATRSEHRLAQAGLRSGAEVRLGVPAAEIVSAARAWPADVVVLGSRGRTRIARLLLGSVARGVLLGAPCSVLVVPRKAVRGTRSRIPAPFVSAGSIRSRTPRESVQRMGVRSAERAVATAG
jgi:nucleotide-binding universal stress UspA family protein